MAYAVDTMGVSMTMAAVSTGIMGLLMLASVRARAARAASE